ncbi:hypothetical protein K438DRAFT_1781295 [Mycena galopus ATCC 62051]|nr:hypothetical protein K438DRAFT_1781295 [Mycena galopus ATCC 62051]
MAMGSWRLMGVGRRYHTSPGSSLWDLLQQGEFKDESVTSVGNWNHIGAWADSKRKSSVIMTAWIFLYLGSHPLRLFSESREFNETKTAEDIIRCFNKSTLGQLPGPAEPSQFKSRRTKGRMFGLITGPALPDEQREINQSCNAVANAWQTPWQVYVPRPSNAMNPRLWRLPAVWDPESFKAQSSHTPPKCCHVAPTWDDQLETRIQES